MGPQTVLSIVSFFHRNNGMYNSTHTKKSYLHKLLDSIGIIWQSWEQQFNLRIIRKKVMKEVDMANKLREGQAVIQRTLKDNWETVEEVLQRELRWHKTDNNW